MQLNEFDISRAPTFITMVWEINRVPFMWGPPGIGKSDMVRNISKNLSFTVPENTVLSRYSPRLRQMYGKTHKGRKIFDVRLANMDPTDFIGLPVAPSEAGETAQWVQTSAFPMSKNNLETAESRLTTLYAEMESLGWKPEKDEQFSNDINARIQFNMGNLSDLDDVTVSRIAKIWQRISSVEKIVETGLYDQYAVVFLDEMSVAPKMVQNAALQLILDRSAGTYELPEAVNMVAAGNKVSDQVGVQSFGPALATRLIHFSISDPNYDNWKVWAEEAGVAAEVLGFLRFAPDKLFDYDAKAVKANATGIPTCPNPRTWEMVSRLINANGSLKHMIKRDGVGSVGAKVLISGTIGDAVTHELFAWHDIYALLPDLEGVFTGDIKLIDYDEIVTNNDKELSKSKVPFKALSLKFAFMSACMNRMRQEIKTWSTEVAQIKAETSDATEVEAKLAPLNDAFYNRLAHGFDFIASDPDNIEWTNVLYQNVFLPYFMEIDTGRMRQNPVAQQALKNVLDCAHEADEVHGSTSRL